MARIAKGVVPQGDNDECGPSMIMSMTNSEALSPTLAMVGAAHFNVSSMSTTVLLDALDTNVVAPLSILAISIVGHGLDEATNLSDPTILVMVVWVVAS